MYPFEIRRSPIQGLGAFATERIPSGTRLVEYAGERLTPEQMDARYPDDADDRHHTFLFAIDDEFVVDASVGGNEARFINHSCDPNCDAVVDDGRIWIETRLCSRSVTRRPQNGATRATAGRRHAAVRFSLKNADAREQRTT